MRNKRFFIVLAGALIFGPRCSFRHSLLIECSGSTKNLNRLP